MSFVWDPVNPPTADFSDTAYCIWKFRHRAGISQQDPSYEGAMSDGAVLDVMSGHYVTVNSIQYFQPLTALAFFIESDPEQRVQSMEGDAMDKWTDPMKRAEALRNEQEALNRALIPGYEPVYKFPGPKLTAWRGR